MQDKYAVPVNRPNVLNEYRTNMVLYLKSIYPDANEETIYQFVTNTIKENIKKPKAQVVEYKGYGNAELKEYDLLEVTKGYNNKTLSPFGTFYETTDINNPHICQFSIYLTNQRKVAKKAMFNCIEQKKLEEASSYNYDQQQFKILNNSVSGGFGSVSNALYDVESYNSITSIARYGTISSYGYAERLLASNFYFPNLEFVINYIVTTLRFMPDKNIVSDVMNKHNIRHATYLDVLDMIKYSMCNYIDKNIVEHLLRNKISPMLESKSSEELSYIFYHQNLYNLMSFNIGKFIEFINTLHTIDYTAVDTSNIDVSEFKSINNDILQMVLVTYEKVVEEKSLSKIQEEYPEILKRIIYISKEATKIIDSIRDLTETFILAKSGINDATSNKNIMREVVAVSDTDSVIFTTIKLSRWYVEQNTKIDTSIIDSFYTPNPRTNVNILDKGIRTIYAFATYMLSIGVESLLKVVTHNRGCVGDNIKRVRMKNEYFMPMLLTTTKAKHYVSLMEMQEGIKLPKPKLDIKGVHFKNSALPPSTAEEVKDILGKIIYDYIEHNNLYSSDYLIQAINYEEKILKSIEEGSIEYFPNVSVKAEFEYANPLSSVHFNYLLWQEVFSDKYESINVPTKCTLIPFVKGAIHSKAYIDWLHTKAPSIAEKLEKFLAKHPGKKNISRLPIPSNLETIPEELYPLIDKRSIIYKNSALLQLPLKSLLINLGDKKKQPLLIDSYGSQMLE